MFPFTVDYADIRNWNCAFFLSNFPPAKRSIEKNEYCIDTPNICYHVYKGVLCFTLYRKIALSFKY